MRRRWLLDGVTDTDADRTLELARRLDVPPLVAQLVAQRGYAEAEAARGFLRPSMKALHDPARLPGAVRAAQRMAAAVRDDQPIVIYGDYDVDGVTASSILWHVLTLAGARVACYVPHRIDEGYGINAEAIEAIASYEACPELRSERETPSATPPLIVSVDCGITAVGPAARAAELGVELIITDHHEMDLAALPAAHTLVHPRLPRDANPTEAGEAETASDAATDAGYPFDSLCGAGVAFKLAWQFARAHCGSDERLPEAFRDRLMHVLPLAALGTVADVVPLIDENRAITAHGLGRIKSTPLVGLNAMIEAAGLAGETIDAYHVGFVLGPRLNASGRMGHAREAVRLLTINDPAEAARLAETLTQANDQRRRVEASVLEAAQAMLEADGGASDDRRAIVLAGRGWHLGVLGIVASRLVDRYARPVVLLTIDEDGHAHGSARSVEGVCMHTALTEAAGLLDRFGGHAMAAGLALRADRVDALRDALVAHVNARLRVDQLKPSLRVDADVALVDCSPDVFDHVMRLAPFGRSNPTPRLRLQGVTLSRPPEPLGGHGKHLALWLRQGDREHRAVAFGWGDVRDALFAGQRYDLVVKPKVSTWRGVRRAELHVEDLALSDAVSEAAEPPRAASAA